MKKITLKIDGMMCGMCESHVNDAFRREKEVKKVTSSHSKGETVIIATEEIPEASIRNILDAIGYKLLSVESEDYEKKSFFSRFGK